MFKTKAVFRLAALFTMVCLTPWRAIAEEPYEADLYGRYTLSVSTSGVIAAGKDAVTVARVGNNVVHIKLSPAGDNSVKAELTVYTEQDGPGSTLKLAAKPVLVGLAGQPMECALSGKDGKPWLKFRFTPLLKTVNNSGPQRMDDVLAKTDAVFSNTLDVEAMYWAWRISKEKDAPFAKMVKYSSAWDIFPATREKFWLKTGELIDSGQARKLNSHEERLRKETEKKLEELTENEPLYDAATKESIAAIDEIMQGILAIDAMYWAWRIVHDKDVTYKELREYSEHWMASRGQNERFFGALKEILDAGKARALTAEEDRKYHEALEKAKTAAK